MIKTKRKYLFVLLGCLWWLSISIAQNTEKLRSSEIGLPYSTYYSTEDYGAFSQNWGAVQDSLGILYFANGDGVLIYDGAQWNVLELPNQSHPKSIAIDENNRVYVGASQEFGYLQTDSFGKNRYVSLVNYLPAEAKGFGTVLEYFDH